MKQNKVRCLEGHESADAEYCDKCGKPIQAPPQELQPLQPPLPEQSVEFEKCPMCHKERSSPEARFCGLCRYDFIERRAASQVLRVRKPRTLAAAKAAVAPAGAAPVPVSSEDPVTCLSGAAGEGEVSTPDDSGLEPAAVAESAAAPSAGTVLVGGVELPEAGSGGAVRDGEEPPLESMPLAEGWDSQAATALDSGSEPSTVAESAAAPSAGTVSDGSVELPEAGSGGVSPVDSPRVAAGREDSGETALDPQVEPPAVPRSWELVHSIVPGLRGPEFAKDAPPNQPERIIPVSGGVLVVGRTDNRKKYHPQVAADYDDFVSRAHALLTIDDEGCLALMDLGSSNGTEINGRELRPAVLCRLRDGDEITLGRYTRLKVREIAKP